MGKCIFHKPVIPMTEQEMKSRITENPYYDSWQNKTCGFKDSIHEEGVINYEGLSDADKLRLYVYAWNQSEILPRKKGILKKFGWTESYFNSVRKEAGLTLAPAYDGETGLLKGCGYVSHHC